MIKLSAAALAYARQPGFSALVFSDVKPPTGQSAAYTQAAADDLHQMGLTALTQNIFFSKPTGRRSERVTMAIVAQPNDGADRWLRSVVSGRPLDGTVMQTAGNIGAITLKDGSVKAKVQLLPFDGDEYGVFAFVDPALLLNEAQCSERLSLAQRLMTTPMVRTAAAQLIAATEAAIAQHEAENADEALEAIQRCAATKKAAHQRNMRDALNRISQAPEQYILVASQSLQSFPCLGALDAAVPPIARKDSDADTSRRRSSLGWAFARESSIATVIVRKTCQVASNSCGHAGGAAAPPHANPGCGGRPPPHWLRLELLESAGFWVDSGLSIPARAGYDDRTDVMPRREPGVTATREGGRF